MNKIISDLHMHSINSDGNKSLNEIIHLSNNLSYISITDHDIIDETKLKKFNNTYVIPGVELTCLFEEYKLDLLCYSVDIKLNSQLETILNTIDNRKNQWADKVIYNINNNAYFSKIFNSQNISKFHIRPNNIKGFIYKKQIIDYISLKYSINKDLLLKELQDCFPLNPDFFYPNYSELIPNLLESNFIVSLAHPKRYKINDDIYFHYMLKKLIDVGLNCIEVYHPSAGISDFNYLKGIAKEYDLTITGGSDHHNGTSSPIGSLGLDFVDTYKFLNLLNI